MLSDLEETTSPSLVFLFWNTEWILFPSEYVVKIARSDIRHKVDSQRLGAKVRNFRSLGRQ